MGRIPFILGRLPDPKLTRSAIEQRLKQHFLHLKARKAVRDLLKGAADEHEDDEDKDSKLIPWIARSKITRRAEWTRM